MFDLPLPIHPTTYARVVPPHFPSGDADPNHPFALTLSRRAPADLMSGRAAPLVLAHFATLAEAMQGAIDHAEGIAPDAAPHLLAILDRDERLVLAGAASIHAVAWCHPVMSATEARGVVTEASQLRAQAGRAAAWGEADLARRLRYRGDLLDGRLVDPLWRAFAARALQVAA
ncbi:MAG: DNA repair protein RadC [Tabrizicola sp.]|nr:DNA repair protein RadC [Tabrizicola sp.]